jgi:hypothetical protein
MILQWGDIVVP